MTKPLQIALPLMLHSSTEPKKFLEAKKRIEALGEKYNIFLEVGVFLPFMPEDSRRKDNFSRQIENQKKYRLHIMMVETGIQKNNSLAYIPEDRTYNPLIPSNLEETIEQVAKLRDLDPNPLEDLTVAPHIGVVVSDRFEEGNFSLPGVYSVSDFVRYKKKITQQARERFLFLQGTANVFGLTLAVENAYPVVVEAPGFWDGAGSWFRRQNNSPEMRYEVLNDITNLTKISGQNLVFDLAHMAAAESVPFSFIRNKISPESLFLTMNVSSWEEYFKKIGRQEDYLDKSHAIHLSQIEGIGCGLSQGSLEASRWGGGGALPKLIPTERFVGVVSHAHRRGLPIALEPDYAFGPLNYKEADDLLEPILKLYNSS